MSKLYEIHLENEKSTIYVKAIGFFKEEDAKNYMSEYQTTVNTINPASYKLIVDASEQMAVAQNVVDDMKGVLNLYSSANFQKLVIINPTSTTSKFQIQKCSKELNFKGTFVDSIEEAYSL